MRRGNKTETAWVTVGRRRQGRLTFRFFGVNGSCWSTAADFVETHCTKCPAVVMGQEHRLSSEWIGEVRAALHARGWASAFTQSETGAGGGRSVGTFILVPRSVGITFLEGCIAWDWSPPGSRGRVCVGWSPLFQKGCIMLMSAYLWTGEHLSVRNLSILDAIGELTKHQGLNWLLEMDAQLTPEELSATGWLADVGGTIIRTKRSTCRGMGGGREIDFFEADKAIAHCFAEATLVEDAAVAPTLRSKRSWWRESVRGMLGGDGGRRTFPC